MKEKILEIIAYGGGAIAIAYLTFIFLGRKTVESWFSKKLKKFEYDLNALFSRVTKIHEKEFEVLPKAWYKMQTALGRVSSLVSMLKTWPDLDRMNTDALEDFIAQSRLLDSQKEELRSSPKKLDYYQNAIFWHDLQETKQAFDDFHNYVILNQVFMSSDLQEKFSGIDDIMWEAIVNRQVGEGGKDKASMDMRVKAFKKVRDDTNPIRDEIASLIQKRLHYYDAD